MSWRWLGRGLLVLPVIAPAFLGMGQYVDWRTTEAIVISQESEEMEGEFFLSKLIAYRHKVTYKYAASFGIFQHTQARNDLEMFFARMLFGASKLYPGQIIEVKVKRSNPLISSYQPIPWMVPWSVYLSQKHLHLDPYRGKVLKDFSHQVVDWENLPEEEKKEWEKKLGRKMPRGGEEA